MAAGDLITQEKQLEVWRSDTDRLLMGIGTKYRWQKVEGTAAPTIRAPDIERPFDHGGYGGREFLAIRSFRAALTILGDTSADLAALLDTFARVMRPSDSDIVLSLRLPGRAARRISGRPRRAEWDYEKRTLLGWVASAALEFVALDPRWYALTEDVVAITTAIGSSSQNGTLTNDGNFPSRSTITIVGPATNPRIANAQDGNRSIKVDVVLTASDTLTIDTDAKTVLLNGVNRYDLVRADNQWWEVQPGANTITYSRSGATTSASTATFRFRDAWVGI